MFSKCGYCPHVNQNVVGVAHSNIAMVIIRASKSTVLVVELFGKGCRILLLLSNPDSVQQRLRRGRVSLLRLSPCYRVSSQQQQRFQSNIGRALVRISDEIFIRKSAKALDNTTNMMYNNNNRYDVSICNKEHII